MTSSNNLQLVDGGGAEPTATRMVVAPQPLPPVTRRPGEHRELHHFPDGTALAAIRGAARKHRLEAETAVTVTIERMHIAEELRACGAAHLVDVLDRRSRETRAETDLWSAHGAYLQHLLGLRPGGSTGQPLGSPRVALPVRLIDRLGTKDVELVGEPEVELRSALAWEIASVVAGETMTEWAYRALTLESIARG